MQKAREREKRSVTTAGVQIGIQVTGHSPLRGLRSSDPNQGRNRGLSIYLPRPQLSACEARRCRDRVLVLKSFYTNEIHFKRHSIAVSRLYMDGRVMSVLADPVPFGSKKVWRV